MDRIEQGKEAHFGKSPQTAVNPPLQASMNPFAKEASGARMGRPLQTVHGELFRHIGRQTPTVVVVGSPGTGKSLLMEITARTCATMGLSVRGLERGDLLTEVFEEKTDVLVVDRAEALLQPTLDALLLADRRTTATTKIFLCTPACVGRFHFGGKPTVTIELAPLSLLDARSYLQGRANSIGRPDLFTEDASDYIIDGSGSVPRKLRSLAHLAFLSAASEGASQIDDQHVTNALRSPDAGKGEVSATAVGGVRAIDAARASSVHRDVKLSVAKPRVTSPRARKKVNAKALSAPLANDNNEVPSMSPSSSTSANFSPL